MGGIDIGGDAGAAVGAGASAAANCLCYSNISFVLCRSLLSFLRNLFKDCQSHLCADDPYG